MTPEMRLGPPPIDELNQLQVEDFGVALRPLFEAAGALADALYPLRPFASYADLLDRAESVVQRMSVEDQVKVLNAHPLIGEDPDVVRQTSALSYREQGYAGEAGLQADELRSVYATLADLNQAYQTRFGFHFVVFVNRRPKSAIVDVLRQRLEHTRDEELQAGLRDMLLIARDRLQAFNAEA